jgi:hypothetical protein
MERGIGQVGRRERQRQNNRLRERERTVLISEIEHLNIFNNANQSRFGWPQNSLANLAP